MPGEGVTMPRKATRAIDFSEVPEALVEQLRVLRRLAMRHGTPSPSASISTEPAEGPIDSSPAHAVGDKACAPLVSGESLLEPADRQRKLGRSAKFGPARVWKCDRLVGNELTPA